MTPDFAKAVDPIFEYVLGLIDRIEQGEEPDPAQTQTYIHAVLFNRAEQELRAAPQWQLAKYGLVAWIDELLTRFNWSGQEFWINNPLERFLFQTAERATLFYAQAQKTVETASFDALEVYYLCVILGFRGAYENPELNMLNLAALNLPGTLEEWLRRIGEGIRPSPVASITTSGRLAPGAPPIGGSAFMTSALVLLVLAAAALASVLIWTWNVRRRQSSQATMAPVVVVRSDYV
jgi:type VI secretion system protein ImpK